MLECAGRQKPSASDRHADRPDRSEYLYILWRHDGREWIECARSRSCNWTWTCELGPIARRLLQEAHGHAGVDVLPSLAAIKSRIIAGIAAVFTVECTDLDKTDRAQLGNELENFLHHEVAALIVGTWDRTGLAGLL